MATESETLIEPDLIINGETRKTARRHRVENPATKEIFATVAEATDADLDDAFKSAASAQRAWAARSFNERREVLQQVTGLIEAHAEELAQILTREQGKPLRDSRGEVGVALEWLAGMKDLTLAPEVIEEDEKRVVELHRDPIGVIAAITPWNVPLGLSVWKLVPALLAGNTMVLKPSPYTPVTISRVAEIIRDILPAGVFTVVTGDDALGAAMVTHPVPGKVSLTGSVATGKKVAVAAANDLKRVTLELGGNDPAVILPGTNIDTVAPRIFNAAFSNNGQLCTAIKRVYVHEDQHEALVAALAERASAAKVGNGLEEGVRFGPLANEMQRDRVAELVSDAAAAGARVVTGGRAPDLPGYFYEPTIVTDLPEGTALELEEQFGPALPVVAYSDLEEAVARANAGDFGLGASAWGDDPSAAAEVASRLQAGTVWVNAHLRVAPNIPFGGQKQSGLGVENGQLGLHEYTQVRLVHRPRTA